MRAEAAFMADGRDHLSMRQRMALQAIFISSSDGSDAASTSSVDTNQSDETNF
jgi:hypothetical protein